MSTHGSHGDVLPFVALGRVLQGRGHEVEILTHAPFAPIVEQSGMTFTPIDTAEEYDRNLADTPPLLASGLERWRAYYERNHLFDQITFETNHLINRYIPGKTVFVGRHTTAISTLFAGEVLDAPTAWVAVTPIQYMSERGIAHMYARTMSDHLDGLRAGLGLPPVADWTAWFASAHLDVALWPEWFDRAGTPAPRRVRLTGAPLGDDTDLPELPAEAVELLDRNAVLLTGGTGRMLHGRFYEVAVEACRLVGRPALLAVRHRDLVPEKLPDGMRWFPRLPFPQVMPRVGAVLHHGGIGTLIRAATAGTPQVVLAHGFDRSENGARLTAAKLGSWLPEARWTPEETASLLTDALAQPRTSVPADHGLTAAAEAIEELAGSTVAYSARHLLTRDLRPRLHRLVNVYGPTETTIWSTTWEVPAEPAEPRIGRPIANTQVYVLDRRGGVTPAFVAGELLIGGAGVAGGYHGRKDLTADRFVPDPFGPPGARLYRTGDRARWRPDGQLEFLGRLDNQIKVRGFRVEPGEVEAAILTCPGVDQAAVVARGDILLGYVVGAADIADLRDHLERILPQYMMPALWTRLPALPLTISGKVDRKSLPDPVPERAAAYVEPRTDAERLVAEIWAEVLGLDRVGAHDDFFTVGGHSLIAVRVAARLRATIELDVPIRNLFTRRTVADLARAIEELITAELGDLSEEEAGRLAAP
ncbi:hypothetical protein Acor_35120 [Acrocarpospora corrugata]|uniref:Carrier domain-containing protein n=2 Tax=Acrocarpospora corrugata TaxID=35763 RepID=A0A5M3W4H5_9ACTN|nr:hypothetical protein Acor_35120 [Acrocarpospora corrugata]